MNISLSNLETARKDPKHFANMLKNGTLGGGGGKGSFMAEWKKALREYHKHRLEPQAVLELLKENFTRFQPTKINEDRKAVYYESLPFYIKEFEQRNLGIDKFQINLNWQLLQNVFLTGHSPFLTSSKDQNIAYFFCEQYSHWENELKYPLLQIYLANEFFKCETTEVLIGVYCIKDKYFYLKSYDDEELELAKEDTNEIFTKVKAEFE